MKAIRNIIALGAAAALAACSISGGNSGMDGVALDDLDRGGDPPSHIALQGVDNVIVERGDSFDVSASGDADILETLRFERDGDTLRIGRDRDGFSLGDGATITVTLPMVDRLSVSGSGRMSSAILAPEARIIISGSGRVETPGIDVRSLDIAISGSGEYVASGAADELDIRVSGSGDAELGELQVETATIAVSGSGDVDLSSNGAVSAGISGSGDVTVTGNAECAHSISGSGTMTCNGVEFES